MKICGRLPSFDEILSRCNFMFKIGTTVIELHEFEEKKKNTLDLTLVLTCIVPQIEIERTGFSNVAMGRTQIP